MKKNLFLLLYFPATIFSQTKTADTIHWKESKPLTWEDFKGKPKAETMTGEGFCMLQAKYEKPNPIKKTRQKVFAVWDRGKSWISPKAKTASDLLYYQVLFNIYELHARKLRKEFNETKFGLDPDKIFQQKYNAAMDALTEKSREFRNETSEGADAEALKKWDARVKKELKELDQFRY